MLGYDKFTAIFSVLLSESQSLSEEADTGASLRVLGTLLVCPGPLLGTSAVGSASGSCCGAVATTGSQKLVTGVKNYGVIMVF